MTHRLPAPLLVLFIATASSAPSRAETCGNVTARGVCQDAKTLVYCKNGTLETMRCAPGELCANDDRFNGAAGCIATLYTGCGTVSELGLCAGDTLLYCANNRVEETICPQGTTCGPQMTEDGLEYDCLVTTPPRVDPPGTEPDTSEPAEPVEDDTELDEPSPIKTAESLTGPTVEQGGAPPDELDAGGGAACQGAGPASLFPALLTLLAVTAGRRRA